MTQIAGQFINSVGGMIVVTPFGGQTGQPGNRQPEWTNNTSPVIPSPGNSVFLDAADWQLHRKPIYDDTTNTGSYGAVNRDITAEDWEMTGNIIVDQNRPPDMLLRYGFFAGKAIGGANNPVVSGGNSQFGFNLGVRIILIQGCGTNYPSDLTLDFFWSPSAKIGPNGPIIDAGNKKDVRMPIMAVGNARIFKLPAEVNLALDYNTHLEGRGQVY